MTNPKDDFKYHLASDTINKEDRKEVAEWLMGEPEPKLTMGPLTREFEEKWSEWVGRKYSVFCNSGSSANLLMFAALCLPYFSEMPDIKVVVPAAGWPTTIAPVMQLKGFTHPIMCGADPQTFGIDLNQLENICRKCRPDIVIMVQVLGIPHKMDELLALKEKYGFVLLEDACAAGGSAWRGRKLGSFGEMSTISCYFGHQFSTMEGGIVSTDDKDLYERLLMFRSHGWDRDLSPERQKKFRSAYEVEDFHSPFWFYVPAYNLRPTDLQAKFGLGQLRKLEWLIERRMKNHMLYRDLLGGYFDFQQCDPRDTICSIHFGVLARDNPERKFLVETLTKEGIATRMFSAGNLGRQPFWTDHYGIFSDPVADRIHFSGFFLPNHPSLTNEDIAYIANVLIHALKNYREGSGK